MQVLLPSSCARGWACPNRSRNSSIRSKSEYVRSWQQQLMVEVKSEGQTQLLREKLRKLK
jgi:hypothetical protein